MVQQCTCEGCVALRQEYGRDPDLLAFYAKKLLISHQPAPWSG